MVGKNNREYFLEVLGLIRWLKPVNEDISDGEQIQHEQDTDGGNSTQEENHVYGEDSMDESSSSSSVESDQSSTEEAANVPRVTRLLRAIKPEERTTTKSLALRILMEDSTKGH